MLGGGRQPVGLVGRRRDADRPRRRRRRRRTSRRLGQGNDYIGIAVQTDRRRAGRRLVGADRDHLQLGDRLRARLPGQRPAAVLAAPTRPRRPWHVSSATRDHDPRPPPTRPREPTEPRRPRPLLSAASPGSVHRADAGRSDRGPGARLEHPDQRRLLPAQRRARQPRRRCRGTSGRRWPAGWTRRRATRSPTAASSTATRAQRAWPSRSTTPSCRWPRPPIAGPRSAGACATSSSASAGGRPGCGCPRRRSTSRRCACWPTRASTTRSSPRGRSRRTDLDTRRPARIDLGDGRSMVVAIYDGLLSAAVSFEPSATVDADAFVRDRLVPRFAAAATPRRRRPLVVIATDGELYGHHQPLREHFLARLVGATAPGDVGVRRPRSATPARRRVGTRPLPVASACASGRRGAAITASPAGAPAATASRTSGWKRALRAALDRLAGGIDAATERLARALPGRPTRGWRATPTSTSSSARSTPAAFADAWLGATARRTSADRSSTSWRPSAGACRCSRRVPGSGNRTTGSRRSGAVRAASRAARMLDRCGPPGHAICGDRRLARRRPCPRIRQPAACAPRADESGERGSRRRRRRDVAVLADRERPVARVDAPAHGRDAERREHRRGQR